MKILQITPYYLPHTGGIERYVANLSKYLVKNGHEVTIYTSNVPPSKKSEDENGIIIKRFTCLATPMRNPIVPAFFFPNLQEIKKFDIVQIHMIYSTAAICGCIIKLLTGKPLIFTHHGRMVYGETHRDIITHIFEKTVMKLLLKCADNCVVLSNSDKEFISGNNFNKEKISVIPNGIDVEEFPYLSEENKYKHSKIIIFIGRLHAMKGVKYLIEAMKHVVKEEPNCKLLIIGDGEERERLEKLSIRLNIENSVQFIGSVNHKQVYFFMQEGDIFVLPSLSEGFGVVILEAMICGLPVIASNIPGVRDHFADSTILVPPRNPEDLAKAILYLIKNPEIHQEFSRKGREKVLNTYTWDKIGQQYLFLYSFLKSGGFKK